MALLLLVVVLLLLLVVMVLVVTSSSVPPRLGVLLRGNKAEAGVVYVDVVSASAAA